MRDDTQWPTEVRGDSPAVPWLNKLLRACKKSFIRDIKVVGGTAKIQDGIAIISLAASSGSASVQDFKLVSDGGDYYNCNTWDGTTAGTEVVKVAKHQDIRCSLPSETPAGGAWTTKIIRGVTYDYTYTPTTGATADGVNVVEYVRGVVGSDASSETDYITPCLNVGDIITAVSASFTTPATLSGVTWQSLADGRAWAK